MKTFTYIVSFLVLILGLAMQIFPQITEGVNISTMVGVILVLCSVFISDNAKIKENAEKIEKLEKEIKSLKNIRD